MRTYLLRRLMLMPITLIGITFIVFCLTRMVPGGPVERMMQEHTMSALSGDKAGVGAVAVMSDADIERLEDLFNLREPTWLAYLQWLGVRRKAIAISREEMDDDGFARLTLTSATGEARVLDVHREGTNLVYLTQPWFDEEGWLLRLESPHDRAQSWARRHRVTDESRIQAYEESPAGNKWRVVAYRKAYNGLLQGSLGRSYKYGEPVISMIAERLPVSLYLGLLGAFITYTVIKSMDMLGPARAVMFIVVAQLLVAYLIELFGMFGVEKAAWDWRKAIGMALAIAGIVVFKWES